VTSSLASSATPSTPTTTDINATTPTTQPQMAIASRCSRAALAMAIVLPDWT
jgi:hypothetical protein